MVHLNWPSSTVRGHTLFDSILHENKKLSYPLNESYPLNGLTNRQLDP